MTLAMLKFPGIIFPNPDSYSLRALLDGSEVQVDGVLRSLTLAMQ